MADRLKLVQGDTRPPLIVTISDVDGPIDLSDGGITLRFKFRAEGDTVLLATFVGSKLPGLVQDDSTISTTAPYDIPGKGGRCEFDWVFAPAALEGPAGNYEGEIEITFQDGSVQTVYDLLKFKMREQL